MRNNSRSGNTNKNKCPITQNTIVNGHSYTLPTVNGKHSHTYNIWALEKWVSSGRSRITNPMTREPIDAATVQNIKDVAKAMKNLGHAPPRENGMRVALTADQLARVKREAKNIAENRRSRAIEARDILGRTALMRAILGGLDILWVRRMISGANLEARDNDGNTALIIAARIGHADVVSLLLDMGAAIEAKNKNGNTALTMAAASNVGYTILGTAATVRVLLDRGANLEARDNDGNTALILAARMGHTDVVSLLLDRGATKEAKDYRNRETALIQAVKYNDWPRTLTVVEMLLQRGADATAKDRGGKTARDWAVSICRATLGPHGMPTTYVGRQCSMIKELLSRAEKRPRLASHPIGGRTSR
jgi:ankyrin repeat protein